jgi:hypothetical protein
MQHVATIIDGVWHTAQEANNDARHVVNLSTNPVDQIVVYLSQVVALAQPLSEDDRRRVRQFVYGASNVLEATTRMPKSDQQIFEVALRDAARKNG